jgi:hypothetical protein
MADGSRLVVVDEAVACIKIETQWCVSWYGRRHSDEDSQAPKKALK